jgi:hypothetical protein
MFRNHNFEVQETACFQTTMYSVDEGREKILYLLKTFVIKGKWVTPLFYFAPLGL